MPFPSELAFGSPSSDNNYSHFGETVKAVLHLPRPSMLPVQCMAQVDKKHPWEYDCPVWDTAIRPSGGRILSLSGYLQDRTTFRHLTVARRTRAVAGGKDEITL